MKSSADIEKTEHHKSSASIVFSQPTLRQWKQDVIPLGGDAVLDAYLAGKEKALSEELKAFQRGFNTRLKQIIDFATETYQSIEHDFKVDCRGMRLRINTIDSFDVIIIVSENDFVSHEIEKVSSFLLERTQKTSDDGKVSLTFMLMPLMGEEINDMALAADGYSIGYVPSE